MYQKCALMLFSTAGALALSATAAIAGWTPYGNTNPITSSPSSWVCGATKAVTTDGKVLSQVCTVRSSSGQSVRGAVIVRNNRASLFTTTASMSVYYYSGTLYGNWSCSSSGVGANSWSVCFGTTFAASNSSHYTTGYANNVWLGNSGTNF
jgi:hypothetical protein